MTIIGRMNKLVVILPLFLLSMCSDAPVTPPAGACSLPLDGSPANCPPPDYIPPKPKPLIPKEELRGEIDIYEPMHWHQMQTMFQRNARRNRIEQTATKPSDAINSALAEYNYGSNDTTEQKELLQLQSHRD